MNSATWDWFLAISEETEELLSPYKSWYIKCISDLLVDLAAFLYFSMKSQCICLKWNSGIKFATFIMALPLAVLSSSSLFKGNFQIKIYSSKIYHLKAFYKDTSNAKAVTNQSSGAENNDLEVRTPGSG